MTAYTIALVYRSPVSGAAGTPGGIYVLDLALWLVTAWMVWAAWRRSAGRLARVAVKKTPESRRRICEQVEASGVRSISGDGTEHFFPWATIDEIQETTLAFFLLDHEGRARVMLPKRGLGSPDLLPALRAFLMQALEQPPPAATASTPADGSQP